MQACCSSCASSSTGINVWCELRLRQVSRDLATCTVCHAALNASAKSSLVHQEYSSSIQSQNTFEFKNVIPTPDI